MAWGGSSLGLPPGRRGQQQRLLAGQDGTALDACVTEGIVEMTGGMALLSRG